MSSPRKREKERSWITREEIQSSPEALQKDYQSDDDITTTTTNETERITNNKKLGKYLHLVKELK